MALSKHVRCRFCGEVFPGWLPIPNAPESAMLLHHLSAMHLTEARPYLRRMATEDIDTVVMEVFERLDDAALTAERLGRMSPEALQAAIDAAVTPDG